MTGRPESVARPTPCLGLCQGYHRSLPAMAYSLRIMRSRKDYAARVLLRGCRVCGCRRDRGNSERMKMLFFIEKQLGPEAVAGLSRARQMEHISSIMAHALGRKPE